ACRRRSSRPSRGRRRSRASRARARRDDAARVSSHRRPLAARRRFPFTGGARGGDRRRDLVARSRSRRARAAGNAMSRTRGKTVRVAAGQGFWGDWLEAPVRQVQGGPIDYLMMDYLAEVTMSIMQKQKSRDPSLGYARDFPPLMERLLPDIVERGVRVTSNAGGVNPRGCAEQVLEAARRLGLAGK